MKRTGIALIWQKGKGVPNGGKDTAYYCYNGGYSVYSIHNISLEHPQRD